MRVLVYLALPLFLLLACGESTTDQTGDTATNETTDNNSDTTTDDESNESDTEVDEENTNDGSDQGETEMSAAREQAMSMGMDVVQSYFDGNPEVFIDMLHHTLPQIGREGEAMDGEYFKEVVRHSTPYPSGEDLSAYPMEDYQAVYNPLVLTYEEAIEQLGYPEVEGDGWVPEPTDFLFIGFNLKEGKVQSDKFIRDGLISFVFGIRDGEWKFVGFMA